MQEKIQPYIKAFKANEQSLISTLYREHRAGFLNFARKYPLAEGEALDIYQDAFVALREKALSGHLNNIECSLKTYLYGIGKFLIYKQLKKSGRRESLEVGRHMDEVNEIEPVISNTPEPLTQKQLLLRSHFEKLGDKCQEVLTLFYYRGLTIDEIAQTGGYKNSNVVKSQKSRCLRQLKSMINTANGQD